MTDSPTPAGLLVIDKPLGKTSMQVCANIRARLRKGGSPKRIKVGHAGTLDPLATGVLVVLVRGVAGLGVGFGRGQCCSCGRCGAGLKLLWNQ